MHHDRLFRPWAAALVIGAVLVKRGAAMAVGPPVSESRDGRQANVKPWCPRKASMGGVIIANWQLPQSLRHFHSSVADDKTNRERNQWGRRHRTSRLWQQPGSS